MLSTIKQGCCGDLVKIAQYLTGYAERGEASGNYNANFVAYVCAWQGKYALTPDGVIGADTWTQMAKVAPTVSTSKHRMSAAACAVQMLVGGLDVDGIFGTKSKKAVAAYQAAAGLVADGIVGEKTWGALLVGASGKVLNKCVHYLQWDSKWKKVKYSTHTNKQTIGNSGCGPTSMAQICATFIDAKLTPVELCALSVEHGYRTYASGTSWGFFEFCFKHYSGFSKFIKTGSLETVKNALGQGALAVCSMNSNDAGFWTSSGHYITVIGFDDQYMYANDPNKSAAPRKQYQNKFAKCMKQAFIFWPAEEK